MGWTAIFNEPRSLKGLWGNVALGEAKKSGAERAYSELAGNGWVGDGTRDGSVERLFRIAERPRYYRL